MAGVGLIRSVPVAGSRRGLLALLLVGALLLCHGAYGALHQYHQTFCTASLPAAAHPPHNHAHGAGDGGAGKHPGEPGEGCLGHVAYAATLLLISLGAILRLLYGGRMRTKVSASLPMRFFPPLVLHPARPPTPPALLQVFRL
jgi:hypothetical protein